MRKIRVFLGGYVNYLNAQNINCRSLSEHLDKSRFRVSTLLHPKPNAEDFNKTSGVQYIQMRLPARLWRIWAYLKGIACADVAYLPKGELSVFCKWTGKIFRTRLFTTVEGLLGEPSENKTHKKYIATFASFQPRLYGITRFLAEREGERQGLEMSSRILPLGVEHSFFARGDRKAEPLENIVFIGNKLLTKGIFDFIEMANKFPNLRFHVVGGNDLGTHGLLSEYIRQKGLGNVEYHGVLDHSELANLLPKMQLMYFPSRSEGFPKVQLEAACCGVPTLCYPDYGASEWIDSGKNGVIVNDVKEAEETIMQIMAQPDWLKEMSQGVLQMAERFDWAKVVKIWEEEIERIYSAI